MRSGSNTGRWCCVVLAVPCLHRLHAQDQLEDTTYEESTFKSEEVREVVKYSPAAAHEVLRAIAEKTGMNPQVEPKYFYCQQKYFERRRNSGLTGN